MKNLGRETFFITLSILALVFIAIVFAFGQYLLQNQQTTQAKDTSNIAYDPLITIVPEQYQVAPEGKLEISNNDPQRGPEDAPITLVVFSDFECPYCLDAEKIIAQLEQDFPQKIRVVWKDLPNPRVYFESKPAAEAARCAQKQGKFWEFHDALFQNAQNLSVELYIKIASDLQLNLDDFQNCTQTHMTESIIQKTYIEGKWLGITATPYFFINDVTVSGAREYEYFKDVVEKELEKINTTI